MSVGALEDVSTELKTQYPPGSRIFEEPVNIAAPYRASLQQVELFANEGGTVQVPLGIARMWNTSSIADVGNLPTPIDPTRLQGSAAPELFVGSFQIGVKARAMAKSQKSTFNVGGILADRLDRCLEDLGKYMNIVYAGSNRGRLGVVATYGTNTIVCDTPMLNRLLYKGMRIEVYDALTGGAVRTDATTRQITAITKTATGNTLTYSGTDIAAIQAGDHIFAKDSYGRTHWALRDIVGDASDCASPFGQPRASYPELNSFVLSGDNGKRNLSEQLILDACAAVKDETGKNITRILTNTGQARKYVEFVKPERRYPGPTGSAPKYTVGYTDDSLQVLAPGVNCKLETDTDIEPGAMFFLAWDTFGRYEGMPLDWLDENELLRLRPGTNNYTAGFLAYVAAIENQVCTMPRANAKLKDLFDPLLGDK